MQECWGSAQRWFTSISNTMTSKLSGKGGSELRGVVKPLAFFYRHLALLAGFPLFSRQATRNSDICYTYSAVAFGLALSLTRKELNRRHDLYLIASLWVVATQVRASLTLFELSSVTSSWSESSLKCSTAFKASFQEKMREKRALASQLFLVRARASTGSRSSSSRTSSNAML